LPLASPLSSGLSSALSSPLSCPVSSAEGNSTPKQQPVDFGIWQAADGSWQLWSCIRATSTPGKTRLFYRWQGKNLTDKDWTPMGIAMLADPKNLAYASLRKEAQELLAGELDSRSESTVRATVADYNERAAEARRKPLSGPPVVLEDLDPDEVVRAWRARSGRAS